MADIFDAHIHLSESEDDGLIRFARFNGLKYNLEELLDLMNENKVTGGLLLSPPLKGGRFLPNEKIDELCRRTDGLLRPVITVNPTRLGVLRAIQQCRKIRGKAFKILLGYFPVLPANPLFNPLYDYAEEEDLPVLFHTGDTATEDGSLKHSHPLNLDELANKRRDLKIVACHFGNPWIDDTAELIYKHENLYADISGLCAGTGSDYSRKYLDLLARKLSDAIFYAGGADKVLFGTDYPVETHETALALVRKLEISEGDREKILSENARRLFQI